MCLLHFWYHLDEPSSHHTHKSLCSVVQRDYWKWWKLGNLSQLISTWIEFLLDGREGLRMRLEYYIPFTKVLLCSLKVHTLKTFAAGLRVAKLLTFLLPLHVAQHSLYISELLPWYNRVLFGQRIHIIIRWVIVQSKLYYLQLCNWAKWILLNMWQSHCYTMSEYFLLFLYQVIHMVLVTSSMQCKGKNLSDFIICSDVIGVDRRRAAAQPNDITALWYRQ